MKKVLILLVVAGALAFGMLNYHFILMDDKVKILKKVELAVQDTFVDARGDKKIRLLLKPALVRAGIKDLIDKAGQ